MIRREMGAKRSGVQNVRHWIAERRLVVRDPDLGTMRSELIRISAPRTKKTGEAECDVDLGTLLSNVVTIKGVDTLQAVKEACGFVDLFLAQCASAPHLFWESGEAYAGWNPQIESGNGNT